MKKQTMITLALALTLAMPTLPAFAQKAMSKKEIAEKEKAFKNLQHPWKGKKVAYFGDSMILMPFSSLWVPTITTMVCL